MPTIDADAHVVETPTTWSYLRDDERRFRPQIFVRDPADGADYNPDQRNEYWMIDGHFHTKTNIGNNVPVEARDMVDIRLRLDHMDETDVDTQVLFPTLFLRPVASDHITERALARSYNRWLADIWKQSDNRLRWVAIPPFRSLVDPAIVREELVFCKENGACGIFMRGIECDMMPYHEFFHPLYEIAQELDLPICFHTGNNSYQNHDFFPRDAGLMIFKFPLMGAFCYLLDHEIPKKFPGVRWAFIEASAQWVPYMVNEIHIRHGAKGKRVSDTILDDSNFYITTQRTDDIPWLLNEIGDRNLIIGTDYGHKDTAMEIEALQRLGSDGDLPAPSVQRILKDNPAILYNIA